MSEGLKVSNNNVFCQFDNKVDEYFDTIFWHSSCAYYYTKSTGSNGGDDKNMNWNLSGFALIASYFCQW